MAGKRPTDVTVTNLGTLNATDSIPIDRVGVNAAKKTTPANIATYINAPALITEAINALNLGTASTLDQTDLLQIGTTATTAMAGNITIPSVVGLLDETAHDLLNHTGLTGVLALGTTSTTALAGDTAVSLTSHRHDGETLIPDVVEFQTPTSIPTAIGSRYWDTTNHTTSLITSADTTLQDGQEVVRWCMNKDSVALPNGTVVRVIQFAGAPLAVARASADAESESYLLGVVTQDITYPNGEGFVTLVGEVNGLNTNAYDEGTPVFLGIDGAWSTTRLAAPNHANFIGTIGRKHSTQGSIIVNPVLGNELNELHDVLITGSAANQVLKRNAANTLWENKSLADAGIASTSHASTHVADTGSDPLHAFDINGMSYHGWFNRDMTVGATPVTYGPLPQQITTTTFTLYASRSTCVYYYQATKITVTSNKTCTLDDGAGGSTTGLYYVYFNGATGEILATKVFPGVYFTSNVLIATVTWNGTNLGWINDERHGYQRNGIWHSYQHTHVGALYGSGIGFTTANSGAGLTFSTTSGDIDDEDISFTINASSTFPTPNTCRLARQTEALVYSIADTVATKPFWWNGGTTRVQYVNAAGGYVLADVSSARYINVWIYATTDLHTPIIAIAETLATATTGYTTTTLARAITPPSLSGLSISPEMKILYRLIVSGSGTIAETTDYRLSSPLPSGGSASTTAGAVGYTPTTPEGAVTVQGALDNRPNYNALGLLATGLAKVTTTTGAITSTGLGTTLQVLRTNAAANGIEWAEPSGGGGTSDHESLTGLQGGAAGEHNHLSDQQYIEIDNVIGTLKGAVPAGVQTIAGSYISNIDSVTHYYQNQTWLISSDNHDSYESRIILGRDYSIGDRARFIETDGAGVIIFMPEFVAEQPVFGMNTHNIQDLGNFFGTDENTIRTAVNGCAYGAWYYIDLNGVNQYFLKIASSANGFTVDFQLGSSGLFSIGYFDFLSCRDDAIPWAKIDKLGATQLPPAPTIADATKVVAVKSDGSGLEYVTGGGSSVTALFPFYNAAGTLDTIGLISNSLLPFTDAAGTSKNIPLTIA